MSTSLHFANETQLALGTCIGISKCASQFHLQWLWQCFMFSTWTQESCPQKRAQYASHRGFCMEPWRLFCALGSTQTLAYSMWLTSVQWSPCCSHSSWGLSGQQRGACFTFYHIDPHTHHIPAPPSGFHTPRPLSQSKRCCFIIRWASHDHLSEQSRLPVAHTTESVTPSQNRVPPIPIPSTGTTIEACTSSHTTVWAIYLILITAHNGSTKGESQ